MLESLPVELIFDIILYYFKYSKPDYKKNFKKLFQNCYGLIFLNKTIFEQLVNYSKFWRFLAEKFSEDRINIQVLDYNLDKLNSNIYNRAYYITSIYKIRNYLFREIEGNQSNRHSIVYRFTKTSVCSIPFESSFVVGGLGRNDYPFLRAFNYKGDEQINYLPFNKIPEFKGKPIDSITCQNKVLIFSVRDSNNISVFKTSSLNEEKSGLIGIESFNCLSQGSHNRVKMSPSNPNHLAIGSSDGSLNIYDLNHILTKDYFNLDFDGENNAPSIWSHSNIELPILDITFSEDGNYIFEVGESLNNNSGYYKNTGFARCWDTRAPPSNMVWSLAESTEFGGIDKSEDGTKIAYVGRCGITRVIDLRNPEIPFSLLKPPLSRHYFYTSNTPFFKESVRWLPGSDYLVSSNYQELNIWNIDQDNLPQTSFKINKSSASDNQLDITEDGLLLCSYDTIWGINDISDISIYTYLNYKGIENK
ncbi:hypothetical protein DICPUDRAFT_39699 [Dictyostelium purpureum]|uniref:Uncharacterized protein n=1 Tax=Dictyostelium purpureum TaxID=5786 RepID=F0ZWS6_DICPU|nr:uncharacterized protein DICPUDRAFT_39699 [Dictyostelium purpureum]EGC31607.1 hypothetical protein DICPUDRAFT_39699 [Dictyostelium purpureum]|eukprot:XP_003291865.1 hypothetical protein DICPUDRAFT_39699 [Dictyostelium purpureum]